jgi:hypothetical protein
VLHLSAADRRALRSTVTGLTQREASCCSFFRFALSDGDDAMRLEVAVPMAHAAVLETLAGRAAQLVSGGRPPGSGYHEELAGSDEAVGTLEL